MISSTFVMHFRTIKDDMPTKEKFVPAASGDVLSDIQERQRVETQEQLWSLLLKIKNYLNHQQCMAEQE